MTSGISLFRKHILGPGCTEDSGRGYYYMWTSLSHQEVMANVKQFIEEHKKIIVREKRSQGDKVIAVRVNRRECEIRIPLKEDKWPTGWSLSKFPSVQGRFCTAS